ncbi:hypothetical protein, partial [Rufibacter sp. XAAS-G3-1]|uniref:hypothetical protein n=1 Tax=Rufibacter sp. XAAS-G3-1 TaxID=2729134 RepID=UPI001C6342FD
MLKSYLLIKSSVFCKSNLTTLLFRSSYSGSNLPGSSTPLLLQHLPVVHGGVGTPQQAGSG